MARPSNLGGASFKVIKMAEVDRSYTTFYQSAIISNTSLSRTTPQ